MKINPSAKICSFHLLIFWVRRKRRQSMKAHQVFRSGGGNLETRSQEILRRELRYVPHILDDRYPRFLTNFLYREVDPSTKRKQFQADITIDELDCYDEVQDFLFMPATWLVVACNNKLFLIKTYCFVFFFSFSLSLFLSLPFKILFSFLHL